jgi:hypothetical protein
MESNPKSQVVERLKEAQNVLVTVSANPSVDQLAAAIGFTLMMNKLGKHATAVFSGQVPSTLEFLKPEATLEQNTDSLRDFIISLDKAKADKLRYKVEDDFVKIFITPYRTSLSDADLNFSQGDFNVDVVMALGVDQRDHVDQAILEHGRILHDATVIGVMAGPAQVDVGSINWQHPQGRHRPAQGRGQGWRPLQHHRPAPAGRRQPPQGRRAGRAVPRPAARQRLAKRAHGHLAPHRRKPRQARARRRVREEGRPLQAALRLPQEGRGRGRPPLAG